MTDENSSAVEGRVSINRANAEELARTLPELASEVAERVVAYRQEHGPFAQVDDLAAVEGVDVALVARLAGRLDLSAPAPSELTNASELMSEVAAQMAEPEPVVAEPPPTAAVPAIEPTMSPASERLTPLDEPAGRKPSQHAPRSPAERGASTFWRGFVLVLLGGLLGVALTLIAAIIWSGTVDFAPRNEVQALSSNLDALYGNQELAWQRLDDLTAKAAEAQRKLARLDDLEAQLYTTARTLRSIQQTNEQFAQQLTELTKGARTIEERLLVVEAEQGALRGDLDALRERTDAIAARLGEYEAFLTALRDLLVGLQPPPTPTLAPIPTRRPGATRATPTLMPMLKPTPAG